MEHTRFNLRHNYGIILSVWLLTQPADAKTVFQVLMKAKIWNSINANDQTHIARKLETFGYLQKATKNRYIVTPRGADLASKSVKSRRQEIQRFFVLNRQQKHFEVDA